MTSGHEASCDQVWQFLSFVGGLQTNFFSEDDIVVRNRAQLHIAMFIHACLDVCHTCVQLNIFLCDCVTTACNYVDFRMVV